VEFSGAYQGLTALAIIFRPVNLLCKIQQIAKGYDDEILFMDLGLEIHKGDRIDLAGTIQL
jgi:hypothetical protein